MIKENVSRTDRLVATAIGGTVVTTSAIVGIIAWADLILYLPAEDACEVIAEIVERLPQRIGKKGGG